MATILIPLPSAGFDPTETAVPWKMLSELKHQIIFSTPNGEAATCDERMISGSGLGPFQSLKANEDGILAYAEMKKSSEFQNPKKWDELSPENFDAILLPGGHAKEMRPYLESARVQSLILYFFEHQKLVAAICHGVVVVARTKNPATGKSILFGKKTTALPKWMEFSAWGLTGLWLGNYYRTYPQSVQGEVTSALKSSADYQLGPLSLKRDSKKNPAGFTVIDGNYISARWPGDAHAFAQAIHENLTR